MAEQAKERWGKPRPGNWWDANGSDWCGDREPHPRHSWRGFAGGYNMDILSCLGTAIPTPDRPTLDAARGES